MTNKTICHSNNVNNNCPSKTTLNKVFSSMQLSLLAISTTTTTATATATPTATAVSAITMAGKAKTKTISSLSHSKSSNITSNSSQINNNNNNNTNNNNNNTNNNNNNTNNNNNNTNNNNNIKLCPEGSLNVATDAGGNRTGGGGCAGAGAGGVGVGGLIKTYAHGIWYQEYDTIDNSVQQQIQHLQQQRQRFYQHNVKGLVGGGGVVNATNSNGYVQRPANDEMPRCKEGQQNKSINSRNGLNGSNRSRSCNNGGGGVDNNSGGNNININASQQGNCDIVIVDIENEPYRSKASSSSPPPPPLRNKASKPSLSSSSSPYLISNEYFAQRNSKQNLLDETIIERQVHVDTKVCRRDRMKGGEGVVIHAGSRGCLQSCDDINSNEQRRIKHDNVTTTADDDDDDNDDEDDDDDGEEDSLASMETLSDNVSIWIGGEKHWISGVDEQTTCADLIWALLNYQNGQPKQQQQPNTNTNIRDNEDHSCWNSSKDGNGSSSQAPSSSIPPIHSDVNNQSMTVNTKEENCKITQNLSKCERTVTASTTMLMTLMAGCNATVLPRTPALAFPLPPGITTPAQLATEYVIVKQYQHCEEYLDGSTKVFDALPPRDSQHKKECELLLRHLGPAPSHLHQPSGMPTCSYANNNPTPQLSSLISTDKDSGMGSPVGSARSAKFRRRKHKSSQWLAQANTLHPRLSRCTATANERLLKIILAQDETIQKQLSLLREKERQINKIEEEKHRKRERELGKNYLLETYLNGLDEAECQPEQHDQQQHQQPQHQQDTEEIFIDEAYHHQHLSSATSPIHQQQHLPSSGISVATHQHSTPATFIDGETITLDNNFRPKDNNNNNNNNKREKKKKRHKEKVNNKAEDSKKQTISGKAKEIFDPVLHQLQQLSNDMANIPGSVLHHHAEDSNTNDDDDGGSGGGESIGNANKAETEMQIFWLEKVYTLNKQLQKEEELAAKLNAKIRRHQLKRANETQKEVQLEIDKLDNCLAVQCSDIRRVEANIMETNEQLQKKLLLLERLSLDYINGQQETDDAPAATDEEHQQNQRNENCIQTEVIINTRQQQQQQETPKVIMEEIETDIQQLSFSNIRSVEEVEKLQKLIAKPNTAIMHTLCNNVGIKEQPSHNSVTTLLANIERNHHNHADYPPPPNNDRYHHHHQELASKESLSTVQIIDQRIALKCSQPLVQSPAQETAAATTSSSTSSTSSPAVGILTEPTESMASKAPVVNVVLDKNMLSSLHVQNAKTIKKQMFHAQTVEATITTTPAPALPITSTSTATSTAFFRTSTKPLSSPLLTTREISTMASEINPLPVQHYEHNLNPHMVGLPVVSLSASASPSPSTAATTTASPGALITLRPQNSHQLHIPNLFMVNRPPDMGIASLAPIQATMAATTAATASMSTSSSPASLMAMNTVDISQLGTLV